MQDKNSFPIPISKFFVIQTNSNVGCIMARKLNEYISNSRFVRVRHLDAFYMKAYEIQRFVFKLQSTIYTITTIIPLKRSRI